MLSAGRTYEDEVLADEIDYKYYKTGVKKPIF